LRFTTLLTLRFTTLGESYLDITLQNVLWAALGLAGTTALAILVTRLVNWVLDRRSALVVEVRANDVFNSKKLLNDLKEETRSVVTNWEEQKKLPFYRYDKYTRFFENEKYLKIAATNNTPKKLTGLTMSLAGVGDPMLQIDEGDVVEIPGRTPAALVDLQPGRTININVLTRNFPTYTNQAMREAIVFSSDEHVRVRYKFPAPANIEYNMILRRNGAKIIFGAIIFPIILFGVALGLEMLLKKP
jgi:hypothetical protein